MHVIADPSEEGIFIMPIEGNSSVSFSDVKIAFDQIQINQMEIN